jgi:hypothetical protein
LEGTRDAAQNWEHTYSKFLTDIGFERGRATPCIFTLNSKELRVVVHGDDFTVLGYTKDLDWFRQQIGDKFSVKFRGRIGPCQTDLKAIRILNRILEWTKEGIIYEADQRHAEIIKNQMGMKDESKGVNTPGVKGISDDAAQDLEPFRATKFRAIAARANYLGQDRSEIQFSVKELCRAMSCPKEDDWNKLKRLSRYLVGKERCTIVFKYQGKLDGVTVWTDSDFASTNPVRHSINEEIKDEHFEMINSINLEGPASCRRSTSGGLIMLGSHLIKSCQVNASGLSSKRCQSTLCRDQGGLIGCEGHSFKTRPWETQAHRHQGTLDSRKSQFRRAENYESSWDSQPCRCLD